MKNPDTEKRLLDLALQLEELTAELQTELNRYLSGGEHRDDERRSERPARSARRKS